MAASPQDAETVPASEIKAPSQDGSNKLWTPANVITMIRICLVPLFVIVLVCPWPEWMSLPNISISTKRYMAAGIFILISCTDWLDGYLARSRNEVTDFGKFMDPLADKILVAAALLALVELGSLPGWVALVILAREFIVSGVRMVAASNGVVTPASYIGKFKTVFQMIAIVLFTIKDAHINDPFSVAISDTLWLVSWGVMIIALILTIVSMLDYIIKARDLIGFAPKESASKDTAETLENPQDANDNLSVTTSSSEPAHVEGANNSDPSTAGDSRLKLAQQVVQLAQEKTVSLGTAESLTGGLISGSLTSISGSSSVVRGGIVSYTNDIKHAVLGVEEALLNTQGAVCADVARQMAEGAKRKLGCDIAISVTGIAGPTGAEEGKPVGTVFMGVASKDTVRIERFQFEGDRAAVREQTVTAALQAFLAELERR